MSPHAALDTAEAMAAGLLDREQRRSKISREKALLRIAPRVGLLKGTLELLDRRRLKRLEFWVMDRLARATIADLTAETRRLQHEVEIARSCVGHLDAREALEVEARLAALHQAVRRLARHDAAPRAQQRGARAAGRAGGRR